MYVAWNYIGHLDCLEQDSLFTSRLSSLNNAAAMSGYKSYKIASDVLEEAKKLYNYITRR